jgi:hypothetical protein
MSLNLSGRLASIGQRFGRRLDPGSDIRAACAASAFAAKKDRKNQVVEN